MKSKQTSSKKAFSPYINKMIQSSSPNNKGEAGNNSMAVDSPFITTFQVSQGDWSAEDTPFISSHTPQDNWSTPLEELGDNNVSITPIQIGGINVVTPHVQTEGNNMSIPHGQDIDISSTRPNLESTAIPYDDN